MPDTLGQNFEPFPDFEKLSEELAQEYRVALKHLSDTRDKFVNEGGIKNAENTLKAQKALNDISSKIIDDIWTVPVMVHIADEVTTGTVPNSDTEGTIQRCKRCKSIIQFWCDGAITITSKGAELLEEDEVNWWEPGEQVAKSSDEMGFKVYAIEDRPLHKHEIECVGLPDLDFELGGNT